MLPGHRPLLVLPCLSHVVPFHLMTQGYWPYRILVCHFSQLFFSPSCRQSFFSQHLSILNIFLFSTSFCILSELELKYTLTAHISSTISLTCQKLASAFFSGQVESTFKGVVDCQNFPRFLCTFSNFTCYQSAKSAIYLSGNRRCPVVDRLNGVTSI